MKRTLPLTVFGLMVTVLAGLAVHRMLTHAPGQSPSSFAIEGTTGFVLDPALACPKGKPCLIVVGAPWCTTCAEQHAFFMQEATRDQADHLGVHILYLDYHHASTGGSAPQDPKAPWAHTTQTDTNGRLSLSLGVQGFPETLLADATHQVVARHKGPILDPSMLQQILTAYARR